MAWYIIEPSYSRTFIVGGPEEEKLYKISILIQKFKDKNFAVLLSPNNYSVNRLCKKQFLINNKLRKI